MSMGLETGVAAPKINERIGQVAVAAAVAAAGFYAALITSGVRMALLWTVAMLLGLTLVRSAFGFTAGFRAFLSRGAGAQVRAQLIMLGVAVVLFLPALAAGDVAGQSVRGFVFPIGLELVAGAFLFGLGMQIAGGCGSGTLAAVGTGSGRMILVLAAFIVGATTAAATAELWTGGPRLAGISWPQTFGLWPAIIGQIAVLIALYAVVATIEKRRTGTLTPLFRSAASSPAATWPLGWGAIALAVLAFATLLLAGRPWGLTLAFALWGTWGLDAAGLGEPFFWTFWEDPTRLELLTRRFFADIMSVMDLGLIAGAFIAVVLVGRFTWRWRMTPGEAGSALVGGFCLGFGAIFATGCNIGAFFSGVASGSLHGWVWIAAALPGNALGLALRPLFGLKSADT
jgi:uncharacterized membrane protein YedE/YeeE